MTTPHPYRLRPYHNPENVDESKVPPGWRFLYRHEAGICQHKPCRMWFGGRFDNYSGYDGNSEFLTYIVPVMP